jgi:glycerol-3-phosphate dehydrogenase (NAD(P)+)
VTLWGAFADYVGEMRRSRENVKFLPGVKIPPEVHLTADLAEGWDGCEALVVAVPSQYLRPVLRRCSGGPWEKALVVSVVKGIDPESLQRMSELIRSLVPAKRLAVLSGPTISYEVARGVPSTAVAASEDPAAARETQELFTTNTFRVYTSGDVTGVELGGALKNVIAIASGIADGLGMGTNTKAALVTRGLAEISRLGAAMGAQEKTFSGLSGLGDLITTCFSPQSRNRRVGEEIGRGKTVAEVTGGLGPKVAEGVTTAKSAHALSLKHKVEMPITSAVYQVLYEGRPARETVRDLMRRELKAE